MVRKPTLLIRPVGVVRSLVLWPSAWCCGPQPGVVSSDVSAIPACRAIWYSASPAMPVGLRLIPYCYSARSVVWYTASAARSGCWCSATSAMAGCVVH